MRMPDAVRVGVLGILYVATAKVGLSLDAVHGFAAAVWPPTGIALGRNSVSIAKPRLAAGARSSAAATSDSVSMMA